MPTPQTANKHYQVQQKVAVTTTAAVSKLWSGMTDNFVESWIAIRPSVLTLVENGRLAAAVTSAQYTPQLLAETGQVAPASGSIVPAAFVQATPDGRDMGSLLDTAVIRSKVAVGGGATPAEALKSGGNWLTGTLLTVLADTSRQVVSADIAQRPNIGGYVRMLNTPSCARCVILAGKWFKWNEGFQRHPKCDCRHIPATNEAFANAQGFYTDPYAYFRSLSVKEQERLFGKNEAEAIRDFGADIYRVVNTKMRGLGTAKGNHKFGTPTKRTVDDILSRDPSRKFAIENLQYHGYITGPQTVGGNILGRYNIGFGQLGKGGAARAASDASTRALVTGVRDPLNRYTMTSAERRLYDAHYKYEYAKRTGTIAKSVGQNSADLYSLPQKASAEFLAQLRATLDRELAKVASSPRTVQLLAEKLGYSSGKMGVMPDFWNPKPKWIAKTSDSGAGQPPRIKGQFSNPGDDFITPGMRVHILSGEPDNSGRGGHRFGTGRFGKTEFPSTWNDEQIIQAVRETIDYPQYSRRGSNYVFHARVIDDVLVEARFKVTENSAKLDSAYPVNGVGVTRNETGGKKALPLDISMFTS